jgi:hypothetical protein
MNIREIGWGGMDWIDLAQGRDQWRALVNKVKKLRVSSLVMGFKRIKRRNKSSGTVNCTRNNGQQ